MAEGARVCVCRNNRKPAVRIFYIVERVHTECDCVDDFWRHAVGGGLSIDVVVRDSALCAI